MSSVKNSDIPDVFKFMGEFWNVIKQYWNPETSDEWVEEVIAKLGDLGNTYKDRFCRLMILAYFEYLEEKMYPGQKDDLYLHRMDYMMERGKQDEAAYWKEEAEREKERREFGT